MEFKRSVILATMFTGTVVLWPGSGHSQAKDLVTELGGASAGTTSSNVGAPNGSASGGVQSRGGFTGSGIGGGGSGNSSLGQQNNFNSPRIH